MKKRLIFVCVLLLFGVASSGLAQAGLKVSAESGDSIKGAFSSGWNTPGLLFSAKTEGDFLVFRVRFADKTVQIRKSDDELKVTAIAGNKRNRALSAADKLALAGLFAALNQDKKEDGSLRSSLPCLVNFLEKWPPGMPLSVDVNSSGVRIGTEQYSREALDEIKLQTLLEDPEADPSCSATSEILQPSGAGGVTKSLCHRIGSVVNACYPISLGGAKVKTKCEAVLVGGTTCRGMCGTGCSDLKCGSQKYTQGCLNYDRCIEVFGVGSAYCNYIYANVVFDCTSSPNCQDLPGTWTYAYDWGCDGGSSLSTWNIYPNKRFADTGYKYGSWVFQEDSVLITYDSGCLPIYSGKVFNQRRSMKGTMACTTDRVATGCWSAKKRNTQLPAYLGSTAGGAAAISGPGPDSPD